MPKKSNRTWHRNSANNKNASRDSHPGTSEDNKDRRSREFDGRNDSRSGNYRPRVSFKPQSRPQGKQIARSMILKHLGDGDVVMNGDRNTSNQYRRDNRDPYHKRNNPLKLDNRAKGSMRYSEFNWYRVTIPQGSRYTKEYVISTLLNLIKPVQFVPIKYKVEGQNATFYVEDFKVAKKLEEFDRRFLASDGFKLGIIVKSETPNTDMNDELKERLKKVLAKRYRTETNALDLSTFHQDPDLIDDFFCPLSKPTVLAAVLDVIKQHVPNLSALNLDANNILFMEKIGFLATKLDSLKILYLRNNRIKDIYQLQSIKSLPLEELCLSGNPLCSKYQSKRDEYVRLIREKFPNLLKLDEEVLPPPIKFDVAEDKLKIPPTKPMFYKDEATKTSVSQFMQSYFQVFDSDSRQPLLDAYAEHAVFSLTMQPMANNKFSSYFSENRNIRRITDTVIRRKLLQKGKLQVVAYISRLPKTQHDLASFTMDLSQVADGILLISITGLFKELCVGKDKKDVLRYFSRTFTIVPVGAGFCITNEQMYLGDPTSRQEKNAFSTAAIQVPTEQIKQQMTLALSQQTNMNVKYCVECLEVVHWNYEKACTAFQEALTAGNIPPEAFQK